MSVLPASSSRPAQVGSLNGVRLLAVIAGTELFGNELSTIEALKSIRASGGCVKAFVTDVAENPVREKLDQLGFETIPAPFGAQFSKKWLRKHPTLPFYYASRIVRASILFIKCAKEFRATHYMLGNLTAFAYLALAWRRLGGKLVYVMHDCPPVDSRFNLWIWNKAIKRAELLVCVSSFVASQARAQGAVDPKLIYNRDAEHADSSADDGAYQEYKAARLIYLGAIAEHKGLMPLVDAFDILNEEFPDLSLDIIGGSKYDVYFRESLSQRIDILGLSSRIHLLGYRRDPSEHLRQATIHIAPSLWEEPMGMVVLEAKREATPSIVFDSGGLPELIQHRVNGYICAVKTPDALAQAIRWMLAEPLRLASMGRAARESYDRDFSPKAFDARWRALFTGESKNLNQGNVER